MSYILDALRKAEAERALGSVPNVHVQTMGAAPPSAHVAASKKLLAILLGVLTVLGLALAAALAWWHQPAPQALVFADATPPAVALPAATSHFKLDEQLARPPEGFVPAENQAGQTPARSAMPAPTGVAMPGAAAPASSVTSKPAPAPAPSIAAASARKDQPAARPKATENAGAATTGSKPASAAAASETASVLPSPASARVPSLRELPESLQRDIPAVTINGYIYTPDATERSALINNRLTREGELVEPGLTLERLLPKSAILNYRGTRYSLSY
ncbi:MAG: general secretion pathway protein GspB [Janthinobacterium lividum]